MPAWIAILLLTATVPSWALDLNSADPNHVATGLLYNGTLNIKVGDRTGWKWLSAGGFVEVRNESRFNESVFPNHNWRGFGIIQVKYPVTVKGKPRIFLFTGAEHESAHATMGIVEPTDKAYELIYDQKYRRVIMNAVLAGAAVVHLAGKNRYSAGLRYLFSTGLFSPPLIM